MVAGSGLRRERGLRGGLPNVPSGGRPGKPLVHCGPRLVASGLRWLSVCGAVRIGRRPSGREREYAGGDHQEISLLFQRAHRRAARPSPPSSAFDEGHLQAIGADRGQPLRDMGSSSIGASLRLVRPLSCLVSVLKQLSGSCRRPQGAQLGFTGQDIPHEASLGGGS